MTAPGSDRSKGGSPIRPGVFLAAIEKRRLATRPLRNALVSAGLILLVGVLGLGLNAPLLYPSLGPTAYLLVHDAHHRSARFYDIVAGHFIALASGLLAVHVFGYENAPSIFDPASHLAAMRVVAAVVALALTVMLALWVRASHPPAGATALVIVLCGFHATLQGLLAIIAGIIAMALAGEALRRLKLIGVPASASLISPGPG